MPWVLKQLILSCGNHHVDTVFHQHHVGISDSELLTLCANEDRVIITLDTDFLSMPFLPGLKFPGIIWLRSSTQGKHAVKDLFGQFLQNYRFDNIRGKIVVVEPHQVRIRLP